MHKYTGMCEFVQMFECVCKYALWVLFPLVMGDKHHPLSVEKCMWIIVMVAIWCDGLVVVMGDVEI